MATIVDPSPAVFAETIGAMRAVRVEVTVAGSKAHVDPTCRQLRADAELVTLEAGVHRFAGPRPSRMAPARSWCRACTYAIGHAARALRALNPDRLGVLVVIADAEPERPEGVAPAALLDVALAGFSAALVTDPVTGARRGLVCAPYGFDKIIERCGAMSLPVAGFHDGTVPSGAALGAAAAVFERAFGDWTPLGDTSHRLAVARAVLARIEPLVGDPARLELVGALIGAVLANRAAWQLAAGLVNEAITVAEAADGDLEALAATASALTVGATSPRAVYEAATAVLG